MASEPQITRTNPAPVPQLPCWGWALRRGLVEVFSLLARSRFQLCVRGLEHLTNSPSTIIICNHQSDYDLILLSPTLYRAAGGRRPIARTLFVAAEQMFCRGYVSNYLVPGPSLFKRLFYPANLSEALHAIGAYPMGLSRARRLSLHLEEILALEGDLPLDRVFRRDPRKIFPGIRPGARISHVLRERWQQQLFTVRPFSAFTPEISQKLRRAHLEQIHRQLQMFAAVLDRGGCLFLAPEGVICDGIRPAQIKAGLGRLLRLTTRPPTLLPVNIAYDLWTTGRAPTFLSIGPEIRNAHEWSQSQLQHAVATAIHSLGVVTLTRIVREFARERRAGDDCRRAALLRQRVFRRARELADGGASVDPALLDPAAFEQRWRGFLQFQARRRKLHGPFGWSNVEPPGPIGGSPPRLGRGDRVDPCDHELDRWFRRAPAGPPRLRHLPGAT